ncbi:MAG: two-component system NtrC family sensor kinase [Myxococcota bacterium]|jgi:two-component system NtrC family sensor kinase
MRRAASLTSSLDRTIMELESFDKDWGGRNPFRVSRDKIADYAPFDWVRRSARRAEVVDPAIAKALHGLLDSRNRQVSRDLIDHDEPARLRHPEARGDELFLHVLLGASAAAYDRADERTLRRYFYRIQSLLERATHRVRRIRSEHMGRVKAIDREAQSEQGRGQLVVGVATGLALLLALGVMVWAALMLRPLSHLRAGAKRLARGDFATVDIKTTDEIGQLAQEFNVMAASLAHRDHLIKKQGEELVRSERLATIGQMSAQITHEIRNPLSSMGLNSEMLDEELEDLEKRTGAGQEVEEARQLLTAIRTEIDRLTDVTSQYLRFAKLPRPELAPTDLNGLVSSLLDFTAGELSSRRIELTLDLHQGLPRVPLDSDQIKQVVLNLVRNAMEAMDDGGKLTVGTRRDGDYALLIVEDTGHGMDEETRARIFDAFYSTKKTGTGLGLPLVQQIVQEHHGELECDSTPGGGTTFTLRLRL